MRVKEVDYNKKKMLLIYITKQEEKDGNVKDMISKYKKMYKEVAVFVSGDNSLEQALQIIIQGKR